MDRSPLAKQTAGDKIMGAHEELEHAEHTAHAGHNGGKHFGITMALLAVLIAFAAAMVGSQRQELVTSLLDQSWAHGSYTAATTKYRLVMLELQKMRGTSAGPALPRLLRLYTEFNDEQKLAQKWDDACEPLIDAHFDAAEGYEHAQLVAELAIIIASLAVLLNSRTAWLVSILIGAVCLAVMAYTFVTSRSAIADNHAKVHAAEHAFEARMEHHADVSEDEDLLNELDPGGKIRATLQAPDHGDATSEHGEAKPGHGETKPGEPEKKPEHEEEKE
jgi:hypothetical protein